MHVEEFRRMNANVKIEGRSVIISGPSNSKVPKWLQQIFAQQQPLSCWPRAEGVTRVTELYHLDRGYVNFHGKLAALGADIVRVSPETKTEKSIQLV